MAGIGFELQRVLRKGGMGRVVTATLSGVMIVAGPWLLSVAGIFLIGRFAALGPAEGRGLFMGVIIYSYAFSLFIFGGVHYTFTRLVADLVYLDRRREAASALVVTSLLVLVLSAGIGLAASSAISTAGLSSPLLFKGCAVAFFVTVNLVWLAMVFISLLRRYTAVFLVFLAGMTLSVAGVLLLGSRRGVGGAMLGFAAGQLFIAASLLVLSFREHPPGALRGTLRELAVYLRRYRYLFLTGLLYTWGVWVDKLVFWALLGQPVPGSFMRLFDPYDLAVYFSNLTLIPGLVYFVVVVETGLYTRLREFLHSLESGSYQSIRQRKYALARQLRLGLREQVLFQGVATGAFLVLAPEISRLFFGAAVDPAVLRLTLGAVFFQLLFLVLMTALFYFEQHREAFLAALLFFGVNLAGALVTALGPWRPLGASYLAAAAAAAILSAVLLSRTVARAEQVVFARFSS